MDIRNARVHERGIEYCMDYLIFTFYLFNVKHHLRSRLSLSEPQLIVELVRIETGFIVIG